MKEINFNNISGTEKQQLKNRITNSVYTYIRRKKRARYGVAAAACITLSIGIVNNVYFKKPTIDDFVKTIDKQNAEGIQNVKLYLNNNQNVEITKDNSSISYSTTGQEVTIDNSKSLKQGSSKGEDIVFNTLIVPYGKRSEIKLSDGSKVWLNSGSKFVFPASFSKGKREVYLEGEAIFDVAHDKNHPFIVKANNHEIEVLGTIFNVSNYSDENSIRTVLKSGSVKINFKNNALINSNESLKMIPGTMSVYNRNNMHINTKKVEVEKYFSWRDGVFIFKNDPLHIIMKKISRYYNIEIIINNKDLANQTFSGYLDVKDKVENVISTIKETTEFQYNFSNNTILIN